MIAVISIDLKYLESLIGADHHELDYFTPDEDKQEILILNEN